MPLLRTLKARRGIADALAPAVEHAPAAPQQFLRARAVDHQIAYFREPVDVLHIRQQRRQRIGRRDAEPPRG